MDEDTQKVELTEIRQKRRAAIDKFTTLKEELCELIKAYNKEMADKEKETIENREVVRGTSAIVTTEVKLPKLTLEKSIAEFNNWVDRSVFYADSCHTEFKSHQVRKKAPKPNSAHS